MYQSEIADSVKQRGYWDGWEKPALIARNFAKLLEELREAGEHIFFGHTLGAELVHIGNRAEQAFRRDKFDQARILDAHQALKELADVAVVIANVAQGLTEYVQEHDPNFQFDVFEAAKTKALADINRGVSK